MGLKLDEYKVPVICNILIYYISLGIILLPILLVSLIWVPSEYTVIVWKVISTDVIMTICSLLITRFYLFDGETNDWKREYCKED